MRIPASGAASSTAIESTGITVASRQAYPTSRQVADSEYRARSHDTCPAAGSPDAVGPRVEHAQAPSLQVRQRHRDQRPERGDQRGTEQDQNHDHADRVAACCQHQPGHGRDRQPRGSRKRHRQSSEQIARRPPRPATDQQPTPGDGLQRGLRAAADGIPFGKSAGFAVLVLGGLIVIGALAGLRTLTVLAAVLALAAAEMWIGLVVHHYNTPNLPNVHYANPANLPWSELREGAWLTIVGAVLG